MSTYSTSLRLELIANGAQVGNWGDTTNNNFGTLVEQAITGVVSITMIDADYTLSNLNGASDEARNAVLVVGGANTAIRNVIAPLVEKVYIVYNGTTGGNNIIIKASTGTGVSIAAGVTQIVYCDGTNFYAVLNPTTIVGNTTVTGNLNVSGTVTGSSFSGAGTGLTGTAASLSIGGNAATVTNGIYTSVSYADPSWLTSLAGSKITGSVANATAAAGLSATLVVGSGGTGSTSLTANSVLLGNGTSALQTVAPGTSGNVLTSNGTTWQSTAPATPFSWNTTYVNVSKSAGDSYTLPSNCIGVYVWCQVYGGGNNGGIGKIDIKNSGGTVLGTANINGTNIGGGADGGSGMTDGAGSFIPMSSTATELYFYTASNNVGGSFIVQAYVTSV